MQGVLKFEKKIRRQKVNVRNILPKSGTFPPGHPVYLSIGRGQKTVEFVTNLVFV